MFTQLQEHSATAIQTGALQEWIELKIFRFGKSEVLSKEQHFDLLWRKTSFNLPESCLFGTDHVQQNILSVWMQLRDAQ